MTSLPVQQRQQAVAGIERRRIEEIRVAIRDVMPVMRRLPKGETLTFVSFSGSRSALLNSSWMRAWEPGDWM